MLWSCFYLSSACEWAGAAGFVTAFGWQSIFFLNLPIGLFTLALAVSIVRESAHPQGRRLDLPDQVLAVLFLLSLTYAVIEGQTRGWSSPLILGSLGLAVCSLIVFVVVEQHTPGPMVPLDVFQKPAFSAALAIAGMMTFGMYGMFFLISLYLQSINHASPLLAGLQQVPLSLTFIIVSPIAGRLMGRVGPRWFTTAGMALMGSGLLLLLFLVPGKATGFLLFVMCLIGIGLGLNIGPVLAVAMGSMPAERSGMASGLSNVARMVGATLGVALLGAVLAGHLSNGHGSAPFMVGLHSAFLVGGCIELIGAILAVLCIPRAIGKNSQAVSSEEPVPVALNESSRI
jgi:MFS transporter, DHA2 family, methylenomycin A resistance protein